jgi:hypothetical protein
MIFSRLILSVFCVHCTALYCTEQIPAAREILSGVTRLSNRFDRFLSSELITMKSNIFWDITQCSPLKSQPKFRRNISPPSSGSDKSRKIPVWKQVASRLIFNGLNGVISQKIVLFITTGVTTSDLRNVYIFLLTVLKSCHAVHVDEVGRILKLLTIVFWSIHAVPWLAIDSWTMHKRMWDMNQWIQVSWHNNSWYVSVRQHAIHVCWRSCRSSTAHWTCGPVKLSKLWPFRMWNSVLLIGTYLTFFD